MSKIHAGRHHPVMKRLTPAEALARAVDALVAQGFAVSARNTRGDSVYLKPGACAFALRVSNHARTPKQRKNHPDAITSLVLRDPTSEAALAEAVAVAVRNFAGERAKRERGPAGNAMTGQGSRPCDQAATAGGCSDRGAPMSDSPAEV